MDKQRGSRLSPLVPVHGIVLSLCGAWPKVCLALAPGAVQPEIRTGDALVDFGPAEVGCPTPRACTNVVRTDVLQLVIHEALVGEGGGARVRARRFMGPSMTAVAEQLRMLLPTNRSEALVGEPLPAAVARAAPPEARVGLQAAPALVRFAAGRVLCALPLDVLVAELHSSAVLGGEPVRVLGQVLAALPLWV